MQFTFDSRLLMAVAVSALLFNTGCKKQAAGAGGPGAGGAGAPPMAVIAVEARTQRVAEQLSLVGTVQANEMIEVKAETEGIIKEIGFEEGQPVKKGQLLIRLDDSKMAAQVAEQEANAKLSQMNFERGKQLLTDKLIPQQEFDQLSSAFEANRAALLLNKRRLEDARVLAPFDGVVGSRNVSPGHLVQRDTILTWLIDYDPVKVEFNVPERFVTQLSSKQRIEVKVAAFPNRTFEGIVFFVSPFVDPQERTALVKAEIPNAKGELKPGMFANLDLTLTVRENAVVIPEVAISQILENSNAMVWIVDKQETAQMKRIRTGVRMAGQIEVVEGLTAGDRVIVEGLQKIGPGSKVKVAPPEAAAPYLPKTKPAAI
jgi:membrane fusion protein (multidrug efflux system)